MITETMILGRLKRRLGTEIFETIGPESMLETIREESLITWSTYYPKIVRGIRIDRSHWVPEYNENNYAMFRRYKVPLEKDQTLIGLEIAFHPLNTPRDILSGGSMVSSALKGQLQALMPQYKISVRFEAPFFVCLDPPSANHQNFTINVQRVLQFYEIPMAYREYFLKLCEYDVKMAIYEEFRDMRDDTIYAGADVKARISDFESAEGKRDELLDVLEGDWYKNPERFEAILQLGVR